MKIHFNKNRIATTLAVAMCCLLMSLNIPAQKKIKQISAIARGTSTQLGRQISIDLRIMELSTAEDQKALMEAFRADGSQGLVNALDKMNAKGRISITGTLGYDVNYIRIFDLPDGSRKLRFVTDRQILFGESWASTRSLDYAISMGEITFSKGNGKKTGVVMPAAKVKLNKEGELEIETYQNPWELVNIKLW